MRRAWLLWLCVYACGGGDSAGGEGFSGGPGRARGAVVARVGSSEIGIDDVADVARETGLLPREALERLVAEELLAARAVSAGLGEGQALARELKKARARALLAQAVEREVSDVPVEAVRARFAERAPRLAKRERRRVKRLFYRKEQPRPGVDGRALAEAAFARLTALPFDALDAEFTALADEARAEGVLAGIDVTDRFVGGSGGEPAFASAVDGTEAPTLVPRILDLRTAWLIALVTEVEHASPARYEDHAEALRTELLNEARRARTEDLVRELEQRAAVQYDEAAIARALADDSLLGKLP